MREWIEHHPYLSGAVVLGIVVFLVIRRASSSGSNQPVISGPSEGLQAQALQTGAQLQQAQLGAQVAIVGQNTALQARQFDDNAGVQLAKLSSDTTIAGILAQKDVTDNQTGAGLALGLAQAGHNPIFTAQVGGFNFAGASGVMQPNPTVQTPTPISIMQPGPAATQQSQINAGVSAQGTALVPAGFFTETNPMGSFDSAAVSIPTRAKGEDYWAYRARVDAATGTKNCDPRDSQCIANNTGLYNFINTYETGLGF